MSLLTINENTSVSSTPPPPPPPPPPSLASSSSSSLTANKSNELLSKTSMNYSLLNSKLNRKGFNQDDYTEQDEQIDNYNEEEFINNENNGEVNSDDDDNNNNNNNDYYDVNKSKRICSETSFNTNNYENNKKINYFNKKQQILMNKNNENMNKIASNNINNDDDLIVKTKLNGSFAEKGFRKLLLSKNLNDIEQSSQTPQTNKSIITSTPNTVTYDNISNGESNDDIEYSEDETNNQNNEIYSNCTKVNSYKTKNFNLFNFF